VHVYISLSNIEYTVPRGEEGSVHEVCFRASEVHGAAALPLACIRIAVQRCMYCAKVLACPRI
jgi:hypothetical protein